MKLTLITGPGRYPVTLDEVKDYCRIEDNDSDSLLKMMIRQAVEHAENITGRKFISQQWRLDLDDFSNEITLPYPALISVDSVQYYDNNNSLQTLSADYYDVAGVGSLGVITRANGYTYPSVYPRPEAVRITYTCGYQDFEQVPEDVRAAIKTIVWHLFNDRGGDLHKGLVEWMLGKEIMRGFVE